MSDLPDVLYIPAGQPTKKAGDFVPYRATPPRKCNAGTDWEGRIRQLMGLEKGVWWVIGEFRSKSARSVRYQLARKYPDIEFRSTVTEDGGSKLFARVLSA